MPTKKRKQHLVRQRRLRSTKARRKAWLSIAGWPRHVAPDVQKRERTRYEKLWDEDIGKLRDPNFFPGDAGDARLSDKIVDLLFGCGGIYTIGGLCDRSENDLLEINGIGPVAVKKIKTALCALETPGISLKSPLW